MSLKDFTFQDELEYSSQGVRPHRWLGEERKSHYIPGWYQPHELLDREITCEGEPQGMRIRDVLPFRRWAIDSHGATIPQYDFEQKYMRYLAELTTPEKHQPALEYIPNVKVFVRAKADHNGNLVDWAYVDDGEIKKEARYTQDGEIAPEYLKAQEAKAEESGAMKALMGLMKSGKLSAEDFAEQAQAIYSSLEATYKSPEEIHAKIEEETEAARKERIRKAASERLAAARKIKADREAQRVAEEAMGDTT